MRWAIVVLVVGLSGCSEKMRLDVPAIAIATGSGPRGVAAGDFDGDGDLDVAVANSMSNDVSVFFNDGKGTLTLHATIAAGPNPSDVEVFDFNRDGKLDLAIANHETPQVTLLLGDGLGGFTSPPGSTIELGARPHLHGLAVGDFDGDGFADVASDSVDGDEVRVAFGASVGFEAGMGFSVGAFPYNRVGAGDLDGDHRPELLVPNQRESTISVLSANPSSRLSERRPRIPAGGKPWMVAAPDLDGDGTRDLAIVVDAGIALLRGPAFEPFAGSPIALPSSTELAIGDLDGDGVDDVASGRWEGEDVGVIFGKSLVHAVVRAGGEPNGVAIADLDGDGAGELLVVATRENRLLILRPRP